MHLCHKTTSNRRNIGCDGCWEGSNFKSKSFNFNKTQLVLSFKDCRFPTGEHILGADTTSPTPRNIRQVRFFNPRPYFEVMLPLVITETNHRNSISRTHLIAICRDTQWYFKSFFILEGLSQHLHTLSIDLFLTGAHLAPPTFSKNYCYIGTYTPLHLRPIWMFQSSFTNLDFSKIRQSFWEISSLFQPYIYVLYIRIYMTNQLTAM